MVLKIIKKIAQKGFRIEGDGKELNAAIQDSFHELHTWMEWADYMPSIEESEEKVAEAAIQR